MDSISTSDIQVSIIILNYNTKKMTVNCVESYVQAFDGLDNYEIVLIDNNSTDGSKDYFNAKFAACERVKLIYNENNFGFGIGNNIGVEHARGEFLIFANSDTLVKKFDVQNMLNCFTGRNIGALSCKILNEDGSIQSLGFKYPSLLNDFKLNFLFWNFNFVKRLRFKNYSERGLFKVDWVSGSFFMCKRDDFTAINGFDPKIFMYAEDLDLCSRLENSGKENYVLDSEEIYHLHGKSGKFSFRKLLKAKRNYLYVVRKNELSKVPYLLYLFGVLHLIILYIGKKIISCIKNEKE